jgi:hypothetical protein
MQPFDIWKNIHFCFNFRTSLATYKDDNVILVGLGGFPINLPAHEEVPALVTVATAFDKVKSFVNFLFGLANAFVYPLQWLAKNAKIKVTVCLLSILVASAILPFIEQYLTSQAAWALLTTKMKIFDTAVTDALNSSASKYYLVVLLEGCLIVSVGCLVWLAPISFEEFAFRVKFPCKNFAPLWKYKKDAKDTFFFLFGLNKQVIKSSNKKLVFFFVY